MKTWAANFALLVISTLFALGIIEVASRYVHPIHVDVQNVALDGTLVDDWLVPNAVYRQTASEYDALTTITEKGYRAPGVSDSPDIVFIGDSFTFGWGLADDETFASIFCRARGYSCANLGEPGTGTEQQVDNLEESLVAWGWRPRMVKLFIFAMTASFSGGNDLADNYDYVRWKAEHDQERARSEANEDQAAKEVQPGLLERLLNLRAFFLKHSNLVRIAKYHFGPWLRSTLVPDLDETRLEQALALTHEQLVRLDALSKEYGFEYSIYLIHPVQDIIRNTYKDTLEKLNDVSPVPIRSTGSLFQAAPEDFYYAYDGHINKRGSKAIGNMLIAEHQ